MMNNYGEKITIGCTVELSPHYDIWMRGGKFGTVVDIKEETVTVRMHYDKKCRTFPLQDLIRR